MKLVKFPAPIMADLKRRGIIPANKKEISLGFALFLKKKGIVPGNIPIIGESQSTTTQPTTTQATTTQPATTQTATTQPATTQPVKGQSAVSSKASNPYLTDEEKQVEIDKASEQKNYLAENLNELIGTVQQRYRDEIAFARTKIHNDFIKNAYGNLGVGGKRLFDDESLDGFDLFSFNKVEIMFVAEYRVEECYGALLAWKKYASERMSATHYEIWRKDHFSVHGKYERVCIITKDAAEKIKNGDSQSSNSNPIIGLGKYVDEKINLPRRSSAGDFLYYLDTNIKKDRIYSYKVRAYNFSKSYIQSYAQILNRFNSLIKIPKQSTKDASLRDIAKEYLGSENKAWIICLLNKNLHYFGNAAITEPNAVLEEELSTEPGSDDRFLYITKDTSLLKRIYLANLSQNSIHLVFRNIFNHLAKVVTTGENKGDRESLDKVYFDIIFEGEGDDAVLKYAGNQSYFSFDVFKEKVGREIPFFQGLLKAAEMDDKLMRIIRDELDEDIGIDTWIIDRMILPKNSGIIKLNTIDSVSIVLEYIDRVITIIKYASTNSHIRAVLADRVSKIETENIGAEELFNESIVEALNLLGIKDLDDPLIAGFYKQFEITEMQRAFNLFSDGIKEEQEEDAGYFP